MSVQLTKALVFSWERCECSVGRGVSEKLAEVKVFNWYKLYVQFAEVCVFGVSVQMADV